MVGQKAVRTGVAKSQVLLPFFLAFSVTAQKRNHRFRSEKVLLLT